METTKLRRFAQYARRTLLELVEARLQLVLMPESSARRESLPAVQELEKQIRESSRAQVVDRVAYTWFNRFCALRYMDVNRVSRIGVVSPLDGQFQPEILAEAKMGHIDEDMVPVATQGKVRTLLDGTAPSPDPQQEAYRLLVVAVCNTWQPAMPFLFERIADYTELLMPDDLLSGNSILAYTREALTPDACQDVEVIGWLYQFYISEKKDAVFEGLKKNKKITPENIPAATQLFTPHWIVRYLVENSLGRLWLLNRPNSRLAEKMDYYIAPQEPVTDFLRIAKPEDIKLCDPACGSGHMLTYSFDLLYAIYEEEGTNPAEIPGKILTHNLYGIEIDERAAELAAFALTMKALQYDKRFFRRRSAVRGEPVEPHICVLRPVKIELHDLDAYMAAVGRDLFTANMRTLLTQFEEADNFGSLIRPVAVDYAELRRALAEKGIGSQLLLEHVHKDVLRVLEQAEYLSQRYQVVVANPPYMGSKGMNPRLSAWAKEYFPNSKSDLFSMFIERSFELIFERAYSALVTMESWMFLSSYDAIRQEIINSKVIETMVHMPYLGKGGTSMGISFGTVATVFRSASQPDFKGFYCCVRYYETDDEGVPFEFPVKNERLTWASSNDFKQIPGRPIAYWVSDHFRSLFQKHKCLGDYLITRQGLATGDNDRFTRTWQEVSNRDISELSQPNLSGKQWFYFVKGGDYRKWYGNIEHVVNWQDNGQEIKNYKDSDGKLRSRPQSVEYYFKENIVCAALTSARNAFRHTPHGAIFDVNTRASFSSDSRTLKCLLAILNSVVMKEFSEVLSPTLALNIKELELTPVPNEALISIIESNCFRNVQIEKKDWDSYETSGEFSRLPVLDERCGGYLHLAYSNLRGKWLKMTLEMLHLEEDNNNLFIDAYGLRGNLKPDIPLSEITLSCNPHYRYGGDKNEQELEDLLRADTMREFISYAVGCMFGRYSIDKVGLILANQGEALADYLRQVPQSRFKPDRNNAIPLLDGDWFVDDITGRFFEFLRVTFGDEHYDENLRFIEDSLGRKGKPLAIRDYFLRDFYTDHVKRYKKRPIYWLFSSPKGSFNVLIYLHRYRPDTASVVLQYLRDFRSKLASHRAHLEQVSISTAASQGEKTKALREIETLKKAQAELDDYERDTLYPLATRQVALDLDDGVKVNYAKLGAALKKIPGLDAKDED